MRINPPNSVVQADRLGTFWTDTLDRVARLPGIRSATLTTLYRPHGADRGVAIEVGGFTPASEQDREIRMNQVSPDYFQTFLFHC